MITDTSDAPGLAPLDEADLDRLDELLAALDNDEAMVVEELDGFLAALACAPEPVSAADYLPVVLGCEEGPGAAAQRAPDDALAALVRRHARAVSAALDAHAYAPVLACDEHGHCDGSAWAVGFLRAVESAPESWEAMLDEKSFGDALEAVEALAATLDVDAGRPSLARHEREALIDRMMADVADVHEYFRPYRQSGTSPQALRVETVRREQPKVGRNEPCPCGSGRKYKACCGAA